MRVLITATRQQQRREGTCVLEREEKRQECFSGLLLPGEEGGEGKVVHSRRGRVAMRGAHTEEGQALFLNLTGASVRPEGSFKSSGSSSDSMAAGYSCAPEEREPYR